MADATPNNKQLLQKWMTAFDNFVEGRTDTVILTRSENCRYFLKQFGDKPEITSGDLPSDGEKDLNIETFP